MDDSYKNNEEQIEQEEKKMEKPEDDALERLRQASNRDDAAISVNDNSWKRVRNDVKYINDIRVADKEKIISEFVSLHNVFDFIRKDIKFLEDELKEYNRELDETKNLFNFLMKKEKRIDKFIGLFKKDIFWCKYVTNLFVVYCETIIRQKDFSMDEPFRYICDKKALTELTLHTPRKERSVLVPMALSRFKKYHFLKDLFTGSVLILLMKEQGFFKDIEKNVNKYVDEKTGFFKIDSDPMVGLNKYRKDIIEILRSAKKNNPPLDSSESSSESVGDFKELKDMALDIFNVNRNNFSKESCTFDLSSPSIMACESITSLSQASDIDVANKTIIQPLFFANEVSRNKSLYVQESIDKAIFQNSFVMEKMRAGVLQGELEHPDPKAGLERFMTVCPDNVSHVIKNMEWKNGNRLDGTIRFIKPKGYDVWDWIEAGANPAFSIRIYTPNYKVVKSSDGQEYTEKFGEMQFVTFDCVRMPGFYYARLANPDQYDNRISKEDVDRFNMEMKKSIESDRVRFETVPTNDDVKYLIESQESFSRFRDHFGIESGAKFEYTRNGILTIHTSPTRSINIATDAHRVNTILNSKHMF